MCVVVFCCYLSLVVTVCGYEIKFTHARARIRDVVLNIHIVYYLLNNCHTFFWVYC